MATVRHGAKSGYESGCRCAKCNAWNAEKARVARARRAEAAGRSTTATETPAPTPKRAGGTARTPRTPSTPDRIPGPVETALAADLEQLGATSIWLATLKASALALAQALDGASADPALTARLYPQLLDALTRLGFSPSAPTTPPAATGPAPLTGPGEPDESDPLAGIRVQGRGSAALRDSA